MRRLFFVGCLLLCLLFSGCNQQGGGSKETPIPTPAVPVATPVPTPYDGPENPLTGLPLEEEFVGARPVAVMLNNLVVAQPQQGQSEADIIYEVLAEGGITRMLGVYQSVDGVGVIGSVRSARTYYLELALGHDAIYLHAGGSPDAYEKIRQWSVTALDCVNGPYEGKAEGSNLFWRDAERIKNNGKTHSVVTRGDIIMELFPTYSIRLEHEEGYQYPQIFADDGTPKDGQPAAVITVPFSPYKTGLFEYDEGKGVYGVSQYQEPYVDGNTDRQVEVTNVIILQTACKTIPGDDSGRISVDLTSGGAGWYACGGNIQEITWSKAGRNSPFVYRDAQGQELVLGRGHSYVSIIPLQQSITVE